MPPTLYHIGISPDLDRTPFSIYAAEGWVLVATCAQCGHAVEMTGAQAVERFGPEVTTRDIGRRLRCTGIKDGKACGSTWPELKAVHSDRDVAAGARKRVLG